LLYVRHDVASIDGPSRRLMGIGGVVLVHLLLIGVILSGLPKSMSAPRMAREMFLSLMPKPEPQPQKRALPRDTVIRRTMRAPAYFPQIVSPRAPAVEKLSIPLFVCAPENLGNLSPEDQAKCAGRGITPPDGASVALRSHVRDPARRAEELAGRRAPARVSCTRTETQVIQNVVQQHSLIVDPLCAAGALLHAMRR
jgi:hypothetical protein